jgi:hypothetical protein
MTKVATTIELLISITLNVIFIGSFVLEMIYLTDNLCDCYLNEDWVLLSKILTCYGVFVCITSFFYDPFEPILFSCGLNMIFCIPFLQRICDCSSNVQMTQLLGATFTLIYFGAFLILFLLLYLAIFVVIKKIFYSSS